LSNVGNFRKILNEHFKSRLAGALQDFQLGSQTSVESFRASSRTGKASWNAPQLPEGHSMLVGKLQDFQLGSQTSVESFRASSRAVKAFWKALGPPEGQAKFDEKLQDFSRSVKASWKAPRLPLF
jgi:hypothetical protein